MPTASAPTAGSAAPAEDAAPAEVSPIRRKCSSPLINLSHTLGKAKGEDYFYRET